MSTLLNKIKHTAYSSLEFQVCYFFARNCKICLIRGPPVLIERKKSNKNGGKNLNINDVYSLKHIKLEDGSLCFFVSFTDGKGDLIETEISEEIYNHFLSFHREDEAEGRSDRRHLEKSEQTELSLNLRSLVKGLSMDETAIRNIRNEDLHNAIKKLSDEQRNRVELYFFKGKKLREIGVLDNCSPQAVHKSLKRALLKLYRILSKK